MSGSPYLRAIAGKAELVLSGAFFVVMLGVVVANVFIRYFFQASILFTEELAYLCFTWAVFPAVAWLYRTKGLISVDIAFDMLPRAVQRVVGPLVDLGMIGANLWLAYLSWTLAQGGFIRRTPVLEIPYFWINLAPLVAFLLMAVYSGVHFLDRLKNPDAVTDAQGEAARLYDGSSL
ncbi:TRAP transporter small permease [Paracoccus litorisediminis]|uniref:TRAP transporter small permease n=1 Tax=Paracoccus litorisediminis TaxID=2006130 RepID=UPI00372FC4B0